MMRRFVTVTLFAALLTTAPASVFAQDAAAVQEDEEYPDCIAIGSHWFGTAAETRAIESRPVPDSFRDAYFGTGCNSLIPESLTNWHLQQGTAQSTLAAIDFFEADFQDQAGAKNWLAALPATWDAADHDLSVFMDDRALIESDLAEQTNRVLWKKLPGIHALASAGKLMHSANFLANEYARAAEHFGDAALLKKAQYYHDQVAAAQAIVAARTAKWAPAALLADGFIISYYGGRLSPRSRGLSLAVTNAFIRRDAGSILAANDALNRAYDEDYWNFRTAVTHIGWDEAWERREDGWQNDAYRARRDDNFFIHDAEHFFVQRSRLLLLAEADGVALPLSGTHALDMAIQRGADFEVDDTLQMLMLRDRRNNYGLQGNDYSDQFIGLALLKAEMDMAKAVTQCAKPEYDSDRTNRLHYALNQLVNLAKLTDRVEQAGLYLRIAATYRTGYRTFLQCDADAGNFGDLATRDRLFAADILVLEQAETVQ